MQYSYALILFLALAHSLSGFSYTYRISWDQPQTHVYRIQLEFLAEEQSFSDLQIAAWRPGLYHEQNYAATLFKLEARDERSQKLKWQKLDKNTWRIFHPHSQRVRVSYQQTATEVDPGTSYLSSQQAYLYPLSSLLYIKGRLDEPIHLSFPKLPLAWQAVSPLSADLQQGTWYANNFYELAEAPILMSPKLRSLNFELAGATFSLHFQGEYLGNPAVEQKLIEGFRAIAQQHYALFKRFPFKRYHFIFRLSPLPRWHGIEQKNASTFLIPIQALRKREQLYLLAAHELFHVWNVKRIRPAVMVPYQYDQLPYSQLLWFSEGVTDYYALLICLRAGVISEQRFLAQLAALLSSLAAPLNQTLKSPAQYSVDAALRVHARKTAPLYYYDLGKRLGLMIDLQLRKDSKNALSLDELFQILNPKKSQAVRSLGEQELETLLKRMQPSNWQAFFQKHVYAQESFDYASYFSPMGLTLTQQTLSLQAWERIGISESQYVGQGLQVMQVAPGSPAAEAGIGPGYLILSLGNKGMGFFRQNPSQVDKYLQKNASLSVFNGIETENLLIKNPSSYRWIRYAIQKTADADSAAQAAYHAWINPRIP